MLHLKKVSESEDRLGKKICVIVVEDDERYMGTIRLEIPKEEKEPICLFPNLKDMRAFSTCFEALRKKYARDFGICVYSCSPKIIYFQKAGFRMEDLEVRTQRDGEEIPVAKYYYANR